MKISRILGLSGLVLAGSLMSACMDDDKDPVSPGPGGNDTTGCLTATGAVKTVIDSSCSLSADSTYSLTGITFVKSGATLTIGAGATIKGKADGTLTALVVEPGAKLIAVGTSDKPIVFTAGTASPQRGDFGGVVILGKADLNLADVTGEIEGLVGVPYGGTDDADNSGELKYVRIEYAGRLLGTNNELNGLTMGGVGSGTKISYVQVFDGLDDCFEWFGGTVSATHLAATVCDDDMFDWDLGWRGTLQFALGVHTSTAGSSDPNGIEADSRNGAEESTPRSAPKIANLTLIGNGSTSQSGMRLRRGTGGHIVNSIVTGFGASGGAAVRVEGNSSILLAKNNELKGQAIYSYGNNNEVVITPAAGLSDSAASVTAARANVTGWLLTETSSLGLTWQNPKPATGPTGAVSAPAGLAAAAYIGAFDPAAATLWTAGWARTGTGPLPSASCIESGNKLLATITQSCTLTGDRTYNLSGITFVKSGATLTIGAGATIKGKTDGTLTALVVEPGAKLIAVGTASKPIIFTAGTTAPQRGDFGGVVLLGNADLNLATETGEIEGLVGVPYGGTNDADSSGVMKYVRIEYAGRLLGTNNELNGLTMGGVGSKTQISYVQVYDGLDDCFEWFGGTVSASHLAATKCDDDMFDWDLGWRGNLQFAVGVHGATAGSSDPNGIEADGRNGAEESLPRSAPKVANLTLIGNGNTSQTGMRLRRGTAGAIVNSIVTGFKTSAVRVEGNTSIRLFNTASDSLSVKGIYSWASGARVQISPAAGLADSVNTVAAARTKLTASFIADSSAIGITEMVWKPTSSPSGAVAVPAGLQSAGYVGAFDPAAASLWTTGWTKAL